MANTEAGQGNGNIPLGELLGEDEMPRDALPVFPMARRGYSPPHVDAYVRDILIALDETRSQLELAGRDAQSMWQRLAEIQEENDRHRAMPAFEGLGDHIDTLLTTAAEESDSIRTRAEQEATATVERARQQVEDSLRQAQERLTDAEVRAAAILRDAERQAEGLRREATLQETKILARRDLGIDAIEELSRVLTELASEARPAAATDDDEVVVNLDDEAAIETDAPTEAPRPRVL